MGKLVYITSTFPILRETFISREIIELEKRGIDIIVVSLKNRPEKVGIEELPQAKVFYLPFMFSFSLLVASAKIFFDSPLAVSREAVKILWILRKRPIRMLKFLSVISKCLRLVQLFRREDVRHIHAQFAGIQTSCAYFISKITGLPFSFTAHAWDIYIKGTEVFLKEKMDAADRVITVSNHNKNHLVSLGGDSEKVKVVYQGLELDRYEAKQKVHQEPPLIAAGGALIPKKGVDVVIRALAGLKDRGVHFRSEIFGDGSEKFRLIKLVLSLGLDRHVSFVGSMPHRDVIRYFQRADVFIMASVRAKDGSMEGLPNVVGEAMACGTPVIVSRHSGIPELVRDGVDGIVFPPGDVEALTDALSNLLGSPELMEKYARNGRRRVEAFFNLRENISPLIDYFKSSLDRPDSPVGG